LSPDVTGTYNPVGRYNGKPYYELAGNGYQIWWDGIDRWKISAALGEAETEYWTSPTTAIEGIYTPTAPATGDATVAVIP